MNGSTAHNVAVWSSGRFLRDYSSTELRPVETQLLDEHREAFAGRVLELGCGAGRVTGHLARLASELHAVELSQTMLERCARAVPGAVYHHGDMTDLFGFQTGTFTAIIATCNVIDVLDDAARRRLLADALRLLEPDGVLVFSSHNRAHVPRLREPWQLPRIGCSPPATRSPTCRCACATAGASGRSRSTSATT